MSAVDDVAAEVEQAINDELAATYPHLASHLAEYHAALVRAVAKVATNFFARGKEVGK